MSARVPVSTGVRALSRPAHGRRGRLLFEVVSVAAAAAAAAVVLVVSGSITTAFSRTADLVTGAEAELLPLGSASLDPALLAEVEALEGVARVVPVLQRPGRFAGRTVTLIGVDARVEHLGGPLAELLEDDAARFVDDPGLAIRGVRATRGLLDDVDLVSGDMTTAALSTSRQVEVIEPLSEGGVSTLAPGPVVLGLLDTFRRLSGEEAATDRAFVISDPSATGVRSAVSALVGDRAAVRAPAAAAETLRRSVGALERLFTTLGLVVLATSGLVVRDATVLSVLEHRRIVVLVRRLGATRAQVMRALVVRHAAVGAVGGALGTVLGIAAGRAILDALPEAPARLLGVDLVPTTTTASVVIPLVGSIVVVTVAAALAVRAALTRVLVAPEAPPPDHADRRVRRLVWGAGAATATVGMGLAVFVGAHRAPPGLTTVLLVAGLLAVVWGSGPDLVALVRRVCGSAPLRSWTTAPAGATAHLAPVTATVALATMMMVSVLGVGSALARGLDQQLAGYDRFDVLVQPAAPDLLPAQGAMAPATRELVAADPDVVTAVAGRTVTVRIRTSGGTSVDAALVGAEAGADHPVAHLGAGPTITRSLATQTGFGVGDELVVATPTGDRRVQVSRVVDGVSPDPNGSITVDLATAQEWFGAGLGWVELDLRPGADVDEAVPRLQQRLDRAGIGASVTTAAAQRRSVTSSLAVATSALDGLAVAIAAVAIVVVADATSMSTLGRRRELALVRALGARRAQTVGHVTIETLVVTAVAAGLGAAVGLGLQVAGADTLAHDVGIPAARILSAGPPLLVWALASFVGVIAAVPAARRAGAVPATDVAAE